MAANSREQLSAWMDDSNPDAATLHQLLANDGLQQQYSRYRLIGDAMRGELQGPLTLDLSDKVMAALADEPVVLAPKPQRSSLWQAKVMPMLRQSAQFAVAASVATLVVVGVQSYNNDSDPTNPLPVLNTRPLGGAAAPVAFSTPVPAALPSAQQAQEQRRRMGAYLQDHQQQVRFDVEQTDRVEDSAGQ